MGERWAELPDVKECDIASSLKILEGVHERWTILLNSLGEKDLDREFFHPESNEKIKQSPNPVKNWINLNGNWSIKNCRN